MLLKTLKLIHCYIEFYGINNLSHRELTQSILNISGAPHLSVTEMLVSLLMKS